MSLWKDSTNQIFDDMNGEALALPSWPKGLTQITQAQADAILNPPKSAAQLLVDAQTAAYAAIDAQAGLTRAKYITDVTGQSETYQAKVIDAAAYKAAGYPYASISGYPWVQAEGKAINGATPTAAQCQAAADGILATQAQWITVGVSIEQQRIAGKRAVSAAATVAAVLNAQTAAITALLAL